MTFTAYITWDSETQLFVGYIPYIHGARSQAPSLDELRSNLKEVLELCLEEELVALPSQQFVGTLQVTLDFPT
jgi:predicted RNase H-like HicB family nuclease